LFSSGQDALTDLNNPTFQNFFPLAEEQFRSGRVRGFGEIHINNVSPFSPARGQRKIKLENPVVLKMFEIANKYDGFVQIHTMIDSGSDEIIRVLRRFPKTKIILSHCLPGASPAQVAKLLETASNIYCELSAQGPTHGVRRIYSEAGVRPDWKHLIEKYPNRFMIGTDPCCGQFYKYQKIVDEIRTLLLPHFTEATMKKLAYQNANRIFSLK
jgi:predicted TIM-barrel fold metal-dependent hydrolase